eukprot:TRINITY_DN1347_c0_g1_i2.p1 TRINITY_DN1347_c0_g1~~TRINITY_DN1347_c0_g1_i2.p1  ORF type:complete len:425 (+),score=54.47 TRINITY_DN1347_c0_g1_i2:67-1275(+)
MALQSYSQQWEHWERRVAAGQQPDLPGTSFAFLVPVNIFYLGFTFALHRYMKQRAQPFACKPFKSILMVYNLICVCLAGYVVWGLACIHLTTPYKFVGNPTIVPGSSDDKGNAAFGAHVFWVFFAQKFWEFLDTWFFLLRKSFRQVTFLHVFHHCSITLVIGLIIPFEFNGDMYLPILLNALVHVLMYSHYLVAALGLSTPWKPWLTSMQLMQFVLIATQSAISLSRGADYGAPFFAKVLMVCYMASMVILFGNFFFQSYILKKPATRFGDGVIKHPEPIQRTRTHSGRATLDAAGSARVELPASFADAVLNYQVTPIGRPMPELHVSREPTQDDCTFALSGGLPNATVSWTVSRVVTLLESPPPAKQRGFPSCCLSASDTLPETQGSCCSADQAEGEKKRK